MPWPAATSLHVFLQRLAAGGNRALAEVAQTVDQVLIVDHGRLLAEGTLDELTGGGHTLEDAYLELTGSEAA